MDDHRNSPTIKFCADLLFPAHRFPSGDKVLKMAIERSSGNRSLEPFNF